MRGKKHWIGAFHNPDPEKEIVVAENDEGVIVGFAVGGKSRSPEYDYDAELYAIYLIQDYQRQRIGKELVKTLLQHFRTNRYKSFMVWVLEKNPSVEFYKTIGGRVFAIKEIRIGEEIHSELALGWDHLDDVVL